LGKPRPLKFAVPRGHGIDEEARKRLEPEFKAYVVEQVEKTYERPTGKWTPMIEALKFEDGKYAIRFWYQTVRPDG
jgi:hypothetical protein